MKRLGTVALLGVGLVHVFVPEKPMRPLVEAAGLPLASLLDRWPSPSTFVAGLSLIAGVWAPAWSAACDPHDGNRRVQPSRH